MKEEEETTHNHEEEGLFCVDREDELGVHTGVTLWRLGDITVSDDCGCQYETSSSN